MTDTASIIQNIQQEMRRGILVFAVLTQLDQPQYGYSLIETLSAQGMEVEQNTLYPLLRRLEKQGLLQSLWQIEENRPRRYYQISPAGLAVRASLMEDWRNLIDTMEKLLGENK